MPDESSDKSARNRQLLSQLLRQKLAAQAGGKLSYGQRALWLIDQETPGSSAYHASVVARIRSRVNGDAMREALQLLVDRHAALRTTFVADGGRPEARVAMQQKVAFEIVEVDANDDLHERTGAFYARPMDLASGPLFRAALFRRAANEAVLMLVVHHIVWDGWSANVFLEELAEAYVARVAGRMPRLPIAAATYDEFVRAQSDMLASPAGEALAGHWLHRLAGPLPPLDLPMARPRQERRLLQGDTLSLRLDDALSAALPRACRDLGVNTYQFFLAALQLALHRFSGERRIVIGSPTAARTQQQFARTIGYFVNPIVLAADVDDAMTLEEVVTAAREEATRALAHQDFPFALLVEKLVPRRDPTRTPIFQVLYNFHRVRHGGALGALLAANELGDTFSEPLAIEWAGLRLERFEFVQQQGQFDLDVEVIDWNDALFCNLKYDTALFDRVGAAAFGDAFLEIVRALLQTPKMRVAGLPLMPPEQVAQVLAINDTAAPFVLRPVFLDIEEQVARTPDAIAIVDDGGSITYADWNARANQLAHHLRALGAGPETPVAICLERSRDLVTAVLAVLKAGAVYVPIDPDNPPERIAWMLGDVQPVVAITTIAHAPATDVPLVLLDGDASLLLAQSTANLGIEVDAANLAYIIYTSGTTGRPKGAMNAHGALSNRLLWMQREFALSAADVVLQKTPHGFDVSVWELLWPFMTGARLVVAPPGAHRDSGRIAELIVLHDVTAVHFVPSQLGAFLADPSSAKCTTLRLVICSGEGLPASLETQFRARFACELHNLYGPTEAAIDVSSYRCDGLTTGAFVPIGLPIANAALYVCDGLLHLAPRGVPGELYLGGIAPGRGYRGGPALTAERWLPDPFATTPGARMYRTGDRARQLDNGAIEYLGRADDQLKIRGFRIEPAEIEAVLLQHPSVPACAVIGEQDPSGALRLVAFIEAATEAAFDANELRNHLVRSLPAGMIPARFVAIDKLPKTSSGKLDRRALASHAPAASSPAPDTAHDSAHQTTAELIASIWSDVLGVPVTADTNFFEAGGHSLLATIVAARLRDAFGADVPVRELFEAQTVTALAARVAALRGARTRDDVSIEPVPRDAPLPASSAQKRLWFLDRLEGPGATYNVPAAVTIRGALDVEALQRALDLLLARHEPLRTSFRERAGDVEQVIAPPQPFPLRIVDCADDAEASAIAREEARAPFDLTSAPLARAVLCRRSAGESLLLLTLHHIVCDAWSLEILFRELAELYRGAPALPPLPIQYADYAMWQRDRDDATDHIAYWKQRLDGVLAVLSLPVDRPRPPRQTYDGAAFSFELAPELVAAVQKLARESGATPFMVYLAALAALLSRWTGETDVVIGVPVANRTRAELTPLVGFFVNSMVLRTDVAGDPSLHDLVAQTRHSMLDALDRAVPFDTLVGELQPERSLAWSPLFQVMLLMQNSAPAVPRLDGLALELRENPAGIAKYDLSLSLLPSGDRVQASFEYNTQLFDEATIARLAGYFENLLAAALHDPRQSLSRIPLLGDDERNRVLDAWNDTRDARPRARWIDEAFDEQVRRTPDAVAIVFGERVLTYREVGDASTRLAQSLCDRGAGSEQPVLLCMRRSPELVVGMLAILKSGSAYVPIDPAYPRERIAAIAADCGAGLAVTDAQSAFVLPPHVMRVQVGVEYGPTSRATMQRGDLAYIIYTSGSTGLPKGVMIEHRNVANFFAAMDAVIPAERPGTWLALTTVCFDISVLELLWTLTRGFKVVLQAEADTYFDEAALAPRKPLELSLFYFASDAGEATRAYDLVLDGARFADRNGFAAVWLPERHFHPFGGIYPNPSVLAAAIAATTARVAIRAGSVVLPLHDPLRVAEEWAVVDNLSRGRAGISVASGWHANDFVLKPGAYVDRKQVMLDGIDELRALWRGESVTRIDGSGKPFAARTFPRPLQPELPLWLTAAGNPETFRLAGELGAGLLTHLLGQTLDDLAKKIALYRDAHRQHHGTDGQVTLALHAYVGDDLEQVRERVRIPFRSYLASSLDLIANLTRSLELHDVDPAALSASDRERLLDHAFDRYFETAGLFGTPQIAARMLAQVRAAGVDEVACLIDFGLDADLVLEGLPHLASLRAGATPSIRANIERHGVTHLQCTPSLASVLAAQPELLGERRDLVLLLGGEALPLPLARELAGRFDRVVNLYGPTETTIWSAAGTVDAEAQLVTVGTPIANTSIYILDDWLAPVPTGVTGALYIGGDGVARGYANMPAGTADRFLPDPFTHVPGARMHRTGDRARFLAGGGIEVLGRSDHQVKIRGFRVDLGEIESVLARHDDVVQAVAVVHGDAPESKTIAAYAVLASDAKATPAELRAFLQRHLPDYAVPSQVTLLDTLPRAAGGKVDRMRLAAFEPQRTTDAATRKAPANPTEELIHSFWASSLSVQELGIDDDFFALGGNSLLAIQVCTRISEAAGVSVPVRQLFETPTVAGFAQAVDVLLRGAPGDRRPLVAGPRGSAIPLSFAQQRLWFLDQLEGPSAAYNMPGALLVEGPLDLGVLERSIGEIVRRHETLRTRFVAEAGQAVQLIDDAAPCTIAITDFTALDEDESRHALGAAMRLEASAPFDLARGPLFRVRALRLDATSTVLLVTMHHIISDGWSIGRFVDELTALYDAFSRDGVSPLPALEVQYRDFAIWQRERLQDGRLDQHLQYWKRQLDGAPPLLELPTDRPRGQVVSSRGGIVTFTFSRDLVERLHRLGLDNGATLFMTLQAAFAVLLARHTCREDIIVGTPVANRTAAGTEPLIGFFANTLVLRTDLSGNPTVRELLGRVRRTALEAYVHEDLPFERLVDELQPVRHLTHSPLFQVLFVLQNAPAGTLRLGDAVVTPLPTHSATAKFDLLVSLGETEAGLEGSFEFNSDLFDDETVRRFTRRYEILLEHFCRDATASAMELPLFDEEESLELARFERGASPASPAPSSVVELFEAAVRRHPDAIAIDTGAEQITYEDLARRAESALRDVRPGDRVVVSMAPGVDSIVATLATMAAGAIYVPIDPTYPEERRRFMLEDAAPTVIIPRGTPASPPAEQAASRRRPPPSPNSGAYMIYTSGSTGQPKGSIVTHATLANLIAWQLRTTVDAARTLVLTPASFDVSLQEVFATLAAGGTLVIPSDDLRRDPRRLYDELAQRGIERIYLPPVLLRQLADVGATRRPLALRHVIVAGEQLAITPAIRELFRGMPQCVIENHYGPSETHVVTSLLLPDDRDAWPELPTIGRPIDGVAISIVDGRGAPVPAGVPGELRLGGLAGGGSYHARPELTAERFVPDANGDRWYRTGDLGRWLRDGTIEFLGRNDTQLKVRGHRVEAAEVEAALCRHPRVRAAAVVVQTTRAGEGALVAYVVTNDGAAIEAPELLQHVRDWLPEGLLPSAVVTLPELPLTPSRKIDRNALVHVPIIEAAAGRAPATETEVRLAAIWCAVLERERVGATDDFFMIGGHSLLATRAISRIRDAFGVDVPLRLMFEEPKLERLASRIDAIAGLLHRLLLPTTDQDRESVEF